MNKVAVITAASKGMGAACAREFSKAGYVPVLMARSEEILKMANDLGGRGLRGSVDSTADLKKLVELAMEQYGRIDVMVNNTGHPPKGALLELTDEQWETGANLVLMNVIRTARLVTPIMQSQGGGSIINISTFAAFEPSLRFPVSSVFRTALASYTKLFAEQFGPENIRMNNILPGYIESYPVDEATLAEIPLGRSGKLDEIGKTAVFLASEGAGYITGENLKVDGGITKNI